ncbi:hypothetical protein like AT5G61280 [Hibiscus trionum]|uniref:Remorin C-terminal domain-containing protein n=1 Tax=Hibiscus trionum TaxID=183268 RepID=A0A9W7MQM2_HIBTR|nr:hypothetical protein like AT5G61280 [Hibiscus trionum]
MNNYYNTEFAVGVAAAAYAINSLEDDDVQHKIKIERSREGTTSRVRDSDSVTRRYSSNKIKTAGETPSKNSMEKDYRKQESSLESRKPSGSSSARPVTTEAGDRSRTGNYAQEKADAWEKAEMEKLNKRCEDMKASILAWENQRKLRAKVKMDRKKKELEQKIKITQKLYQAKIAIIDHIAGGARAEADEKRRKDELKIKQKARKIRGSGKVPVSCFCF